MKDKSCKIPEDQEIMTIEEGDKPPVMVIHEGPTQPEERVQMNNELEEAEEAAAEDDPECIKPANAGFFAGKMRAKMELALEEGKKALQEGEIPIGAVVLKDGKVIARAYNQREKLSDPSAHAEILALREAGKKLGDWRLNGCEIYVTAEPCPMCLSAIMQARVSRLVYGTSEPAFGAVESLVRLPKEHPGGKSLEIYPGILEDECQALLKDFFSRKREKAKTGLNKEQ